MPQSNNPTTSDVKKLIDGRNGRPKTKDRTAPQVATATFGLTQPELQTSYPTADWFSKVRTMRKDPTISLVRDLVVGPIVTSEWSIGHTDEAPKGAPEFIGKNINNLRSYLVTHSLTGWMDFGWQVFEKVWAIDENGMTVIDKVKPLLQDITRILVNTDTGEYLGTLQLPIHGKKFESRIIGDDLAFGSGFLKTRETILTNINVEGTYWYGRAIMANVLVPYNGWVTVNCSADRYDQKIAGSHWVIHYPLGNTIIDDVETDNFTIAQNLLQNLESSGAIAVPRQVDQMIAFFNETGKAPPDAWKIEILSDQTNQQSNFIDRLKYYDILKVRALGFPERSVLEGQFGTKAEAEVHSDLAVVIAEYRHTRLTEHISYQLVNDLLRYNYGKEAIGTVFLKPAPIADDIKLFLRQVFQTLMQHDPETALKKINADEVKERLGLPMNTKDDDDSGFIFPEKVDLAANNTTNVISKAGTGLNPVEGEVTKTVKD